MMKKSIHMKFLITVLSVVTFLNVAALAQVSPDEIKFVRQGVRRMIFDRSQDRTMAVKDYWVRCNASSSRFSNK